MSLNYLLDGYNIIKHIPRLAQKRLEDSRESLIRLIETYRPQGSPQNSVTIVFDGQEGLIGGETQSGCVKTIFSSGESADDRIKKIVSRAEHKKRIVVVTNDKDIKFSVRAQGAAVLTVDEFMERMHPPKKRASSSTETKNISQTLEYQITQEMEQIWLKKDEQRKQKS